MPPTNPPMTASVYELLPMAHVVDVEASIKFYELLGFRVRNQMSHGGRTNWASLLADRGHLMLAAGTPFAASRARPSRARANTA